MGICDSFLTSLPSGSDRVMVASRPVRFYIFLQRGECKALIECLRGPILVFSSSIATLFVKLKFRLRAEFKFYGAWNVQDFGTEYL